MSSLKVLEIHREIKKLNIINYSINPDNLAVDVSCNVDISRLGITYIPVQFESVEGKFDCQFNNLKSLINTPKYIKGNFNASNNDIMTLKTSPIIECHDFDCSHNNLTSLEGFPRNIKPRSVIDLSSNSIESLEGLNMEEVGKLFMISSNKLKNFIGGPKYVEGNFVCSWNPIESLEGFPKYVGGHIYVGVRDDLMSEDVVSEDKIRKICEVKGSVMIFNSYGEDI